MRPEDRYYLLIFVRYFSVTFVISWTIWALIPLFNSPNYFVNLWIAVLGLYGPSLAGLILAFRFQGTYWQHYLPDPKLFFPIFAISFGLGIGYMYRISQVVDEFASFLTFGVVMLILLASLLTSYFLAVMVRSPPGFETRNDQPFQIRSQLGMIVFALVFPLAIGLLSFIILRVSGIISKDLVNLITSSFQLPFFLISFSFLFSGAANEEIGWRGYLTPKALQRLNPLLVGLIIGFFLEPMASSSAYNRILWWWS